MILDKLSIHLLERVIEYFSVPEMKYALLINRFFAEFILKQLKKRLNVTMLADDNPKRTLKKFPFLKKLVLIITTSHIRELKDIIVLIPNTLKSLKLQLNNDLLLSKKFYTYIYRYQYQLITLKLQAIGPSIGVKAQEINVKFLHNIFYYNMKQLETFKIITAGLRTIDLVQNYLFQALFYHDEVCESQPTIKKIQFDQLNMPGNFRINTNIMSVAIKQFTKNDQINLTQNLGLLTSLFGPQVTSMKLTQHVDEHTIMQADNMRLFLNHFVNLQSFQFNIYNISYEIMNFQLDDVAKLSLKSLGLASLKAHQSHFASLLSQLPFLQIVNLDFTHIDDECLLIISIIDDYKVVQI